MSIYAINVTPHGRERLTELFGESVIMHRRGDLGGMQKAVQGGAMLVCPVSIAAVVKPHLIEELSPQGDHLYFRDGQAGVPL